MSDPVIRLNVALKGRYRIEREWVRVAWRRCTWPTTSVDSTLVAVSDLLAESQMAKLVARDLEGNELELWLLAKGVRACRFGGCQ